MSSSIPRDSRSNQKKTLSLASFTSKPKGLRQAGVAPSDDMLPGTYSAACEAARIVGKFGKPTVECSFRVIDGDHFGTALPGWFHIKIVGDLVMPGCQYTKICELVLGREIEPGDDIDPETVLVGKKLKVGVRFRATDGKRLSAQDENTKKDGKDFLRVSSILGEVSL